MYNLRRRDDIIEKFGTGSGYRSHSLIPENIDFKIWPGYCINVLDQTFSKWLVFWRENCKIYNSPPSYTFYLAQHALKLKLSFGKNESNLNAKCIVLCKSYFENTHTYLIRNNICTFCASSVNSTMDWKSRPVAPVRTNRALPYLMMILPYLKHFGPSTDFATSEWLILITNCNWNLKVLNFLNKFYKEELSERSTNYMLYF